MTDVIASLALEMDARPLTQPADASTAALGKIGDAAVAAQTKVSAASKEMGAAQAAAREEAKRGAAAREQLIGAFEKEAAAIRAKSTVMLSEVEVYRKVMQARRDALALADRERAETVAWVQDLKRKEEAAAAAAVPVAGVGRAAAGTATGLRTMSTGLANLAAQEIGLRSGLGSLLGAVSNFGLGALTSVGVFAGLAAISLAYSAITKTARESREAIQKVIDKLREQALAQHQTANLTRLQVQAEIQHLQEKLVAAQAIANAPTSGEKGAAGQQQRALAEVLRLEEKLKDYGDYKRHADAAAEDERQTRHEKEVQDLVTVINLHKASAAELARRKQLIAEDQAALAKSGITLAERARLQVEINTLTEAGIKKTREAGVAVDLYAESIRRARQSPDGGGLGSPIDPRGGFGGFLTPDTLRGFAEADRIRKEQLDKDRAASRERSKIINDSIRDVVFEAGKIGHQIADQMFGTPEQQKAAQQRFEAALRTVTDSLQRGFAALFSGKNPFDGLVQLAQQAAASIAAAFTVKSLGIDSLLKRITSQRQVSLGNAGNAEVGGGFGLGGPIALAGGIVAGFISTLVGNAAKEREAARAAAEAQKAYNLSLADFVAIAKPRGVLGDALASLTKQFEDLATQAAAATGIKVGPGASGSNSALGFTQDELLKRLREYDAEAAKYGPRWAEMTSATRRYFETLLDLRKAFDANIEATTRRIALERQQFGEDQIVRQLRAQGLTAEADAEAFRLDQQRKFQAVVEKYGASQTDAEKAANAALIAQEAYTQSLEREAYLKAQAMEVQRKLNEQIGLGLSLDEQLFGAKGDPAGAARARRDAGIFDTGLKLQSGGLSPENAQKTFDLIWLTFNNTMRDIADAAEAATLALFTYNRAAREDLTVRLLVAQGQSDQADALRQRLADERDYAQAVRDGADAVTLAMLATVQAAEANRRAADEAKRLAQAMEEQARAFENLTIRMLRATGQGGAADQGAQLFAQQEERRKAIEAGRSQAYLDQLDAVQKQERAFADAARRAAQQQAFDQAFPTTTAGVIAQSATSVNLAVGVSESTAGRLTGLMSSQVAIAQQQLALQAYLPRIYAQLKANAAAGGGASFQDFDETWADETAVGERVAGNPPSNR